MKYKDLFQLFYDTSSIIKASPFGKEKNKKEKEKSFTLRDFINDSGLLKVVEKLFNDGHHARAVEEAFKFLNNYIKKIAKVSEDGASLMRKVFSVNNPIIKLNSGSNQSENDEQQGYMDIFAGCMMGIRNPRVHEHDWEDPQDRAIQLLLIADHLLDKVKSVIK
ncbi:MAG: TIGR02391 family protein [Brevinematales bacterium]|nr:TIGR02391 family protein [Brevinematales bacterium]